MLKRLLRWLRRLVIALVLLLPFLYWASRTTAPALPEGVTKEVRQLVLAGEQVSVTFYYPPHSTEAPLVVVAHGFARGKRYMAGWGTELAAQGFLAAVPTQPALANHSLNARVLAELVAQLRQGKVSVKVKPSPRAALMGFSMGGLTTLLAAGQQPVDAWVGLDPVVMDKDWPKVAKAQHIPCGVLRAEPQAWNHEGNARQLLAFLPGPTFAIKIRNGTHLDVESPTDILGQLACGWADPARHALFKRYAIAFLKAQLMDDKAAKEILAGAVSDPALDEVVMGR